MQIIKKINQHIKGVFGDRQSNPVNVIRQNEDLIYDIGLHTGQDTDFYLKKGFNVVAVEANPLLVEGCEKRFAKYLKTGQLTILNVGIGIERGTFPFYVNENHSEWSSFTKEIGARLGKFHEIPVECIRMEDLFNQYGTPYYLKIDIEGHDFIALKAVEHLTEKPCFISVENGGKHFLDFFYEQGYRRFKFINQKFITEQKVVFPPKEGKYVEHNFEFGSSGLFGNETPGDWKGFEEILIDINTYWDNPARDANIHGWYDLHAG